MSGHATQRLQDRVTCRQTWGQTSSQGGSECGGGNRAGTRSGTWGSSLSPLGLSLEGTVETSFLWKRPPDRFQALGPRSHPAAPCCVPLGRPLPPPGLGDLPGCL